MSDIGVGWKNVAHILGLHAELDREDDGRWIAEITDMPGVMAYGSTQDEALERAFSLALRVIFMGKDDA